MRDRDEVPYIVIERDSGGQFGPFVLGALVGAGLALLFAPQSGEETQEDLRERAGKLRAAAEDRVREAQRHLEERLELVRHRALPVTAMREDRSMWQLFIDDFDHVVDVFRKHDEAVKDYVDPDRLLVYEVSEGWEPLCRHLGVPIPNEAFPRTNTTDDYKVERKIRQAELEAKSAE